MADVSLLTLLIGPAVVGAAVGAIVAPIVTALKARNLWVFQQRLDVYSSVCDYVETVDRVARAPRLTTDSPPILPLPPELLSGRVALLASKRVSESWQEYRHAVNYYNHDVAMSPGIPLIPAERDRTLIGLNMTAICTEEMGVREPRRHTEGARRRRHWWWQWGLHFQRYWWQARAPLRSAKTRLTPPAPQSRLDGPRDVD